MGEGRPDRFADGAATGTPAARSRASATGWSGTRTATLGRPGGRRPRQPGAAVSTSVSGPGQNALRQPQRQGGRPRGHPPGGLRVRRVHDHRVVGRPALRREDARHRRAGRGRSRPARRPSPWGTRPARPSAAHRRARRPASAATDSRRAHDRTRSITLRPMARTPLPRDRIRPRRQRPTIGRMPRIHTGTARRATTLLIRDWQPTATPWAYVLLVHGVGEHSGRYERTGRHLRGCRHRGDRVRPARSRRLERARGATSSAGPTTSTTSAGCWRRCARTRQGGRWS